MNLPLSDVAINQSAKTSPFSDPEDTLRSQRIRQVIMEKGNKLREDHPWLVKYQDEIGLAILLTASAGITFNAVQYARGKMPWQVVVPLSAFWMSILHELEHDLIHQMYFRKNKTMQNVMLATVYAFRPSTINPWVRRDLHLHHHKSSGTKSDLEERGITNGTKWGLRRLLMIGDNMLSVYLRPIDTIKANKAFIQAQKNLDSKQKRTLSRRVTLGYFPLGMMHYSLWHGFLGLSALKLGMKVVGLKKPTNKLWTMLDRSTKFYAVNIAAPNFLRTFCLHFVSSNIHYYSDVEDGNIVQQCQVWTDKRLAPLHAFCFNFGGTHAIHHFVVRDPFYIRQAIAKDCYDVMKENGVRFNDFGTFKRANRRFESSQT